MWTVDLHTARKGLWLALGIVAISAAAAAGASSGSGGGTITTIARLSGPGGVAVDRSGNVYFADGDQVRKRDTARRNHHDCRYGQGGLEPRTADAFEEVTLQFGLGIAPWMEEHCSPEILSQVAEVASG